MKVGRLTREAGVVRVEVEGSRYVWFGWAFVVAALLAASSALLVDSLGTRITWGVGAAVLGLIALAAFVQGRRPATPILTVREEGLEHPHAGLIQWREVADVREFEPRRGHGRCVGIWLVDPQLIPNRSRAPLLQPLAALGARAGFPAIAIPESMAPVDELLREIKSYRDKADS